ncbi:hypothetical protein Fleli_1483 [Bernardetia litoralis DSM 6794]|uniref:DUF4424 domain-containing protein n=1 Tax=Bernardetia litoralis (strain ATCC 23117 / DSM 6794 / NBRC 15988 / NCIMB 1366 / Fx l1 / Sio-4) TaxID=880071 RepID=I4AIX2_BERLS|nr:hypothetical protein [Bernardetia litoralis]AFM03907.1 hypothetical protein Fleli_1483 [Bernardetia litoralis DSM 6794]
MKNLTLLFFLFFQTLSLAFANGGVVDENYFKKTGNIRLLQKADISLLKEDLRIKIVSDTTFIEVTYFLKNNGNTQSVHYGFPVDIYETEYTVYPYVGVLYFEAEVNNIPKKYAYWRVKNAYESNQYNKENNRKYTSKVDRQWYALKIDFEEGTTQTLTIKYAIQNYRSDYYYGFGFIPTPSERRFVYDLFPSSSWADGIVNDFSVIMDLSDLYQHKCNPKIEGLENLKEENGIYTLQAQDFDLKKRSYLAVIYKNQRRVIASDLKREYELFPILSISSSAENAEYLIDNDPNTVWKGKEGDWIKIKLPKVLTYIKDKNGETKSKIVYPMGICFLNGDYSSKENFDGTGKVKKMLFQVNGATIINYDHDAAVINRISLDKAVFLSHFDTNSLYEHLVTPFGSHLWNRIMHGQNAQAGKLFSKINEEYFHTLYIQIKKSDRENKEVALSDLYIFRYKKGYGTDLFY